MLYDILFMPNKLDIQIFGYIFFLKDNYTFFTHTLIIEFDKMQIPYRRVCYTRSVYSLFGDNWGLRFCALTSVDAFFYL